MTTFLDAAYYYSQLGWKIFPLVPNGKIPAIPKDKGGQGFKDASSDPKKIEAWACTYPNCNIGIATGAMSGIAVIDIDPRNGGTESVLALFRKGHVFPPGPEAITGNGGKHLFYKLPPGLRGSKNRLGRGIDIKADGGYVVAAPSRIDKSEQGPGGEYKWTFVPRRGQELPPFPNWALELLEPQQREVRTFKGEAASGMAERGLESMADLLAKQGEGNRNNFLNWAAFHAGRSAHERRLDGRKVYARLMAAALSCGLSHHEAEATFRSGYFAAAKK